MTPPEPTYVLDANVLVQAHRRWYGFADVPCIDTFAMLRILKARFVENTH
jgi:hypothetical protein